MPFHRNYVEYNNHTPISFNFANEAARIDSTNPYTGLAYTSEDLYKFCIQIDTGEVYVLTDTTPTWEDVGGGGASGADRVLENTRIIEGGAISINAGDDATWDLASGSGIYLDFNDVVNNPTEYSYVWSAQTGLTVTDIATADKTAVAITHDNTARTGIVFTNSFSGTVNGASATLYIAEKTGDDANFDPEERRIYAYLGRLTHFDNTSIFDAASLPGLGYSPFSYADEIYRFVGPTNFNGNEYSGIAATSTVEKSAGEVFAEGGNFENNVNNPNFTTNAAVSPITFLFRYYDASTSSIERNGASSTFPFSTWNDTTDAVTPLKTVGTDEWVAHRIYLFAASNNTILQYGQRTYVSQETAIEDLETNEWVEDSDLISNAAKRGWVVCRGGETDTTGDWQWIAPTVNRSGNKASSLLTTMQNAYDGSIDRGSNPEITVRDLTDGDVTIRDSSTNTNRDPIFCVQETGGDNILEIQRNLFEVGDSGASAYRPDTARLNANNTSEIRIEDGSSNSGFASSFFLSGRPVVQLGLLDNGGADYTGFTMNLVDGDVTFEDSLNGAGVQYSADYSANYTDRSLVDRAGARALTLAEANQVLTSNRTITGNSGDSLTSDHYNGTSSTYTLRSQILQEDDDITITTALGDGFGADIATSSLSMLNTGLEIRTEIGDTQVFLRSNDWIFYRTNNTNDPLLTVHGDGNHSVFDPYLTFHEGWLVSSNSDDTDYTVLNQGKGVTWQWNDGTDSSYVFRLRSLINGAGTFQHMEWDYASQRQDFVNLDRFDWYFDGTAGGTTTTWNIYDDSAGTTQLFSFNGSNGNLTIDGNFTANNITAGNNLTVTADLMIEGSASSDDFWDIDGGSGLNDFLRIRYYDDGLGTTTTKLEYNPTTDEFTVTGDILADNIFDQVPSCTVGTALAQTVTTTDAVIPLTSIKVDGSGSEYTIDTTGNDITFDGADGSKIFEVSVSMRFDLQDQGSTGDTRSYAISTPRINATADTDYEMWTYIREFQGGNNGVANTGGAYTFQIQPAANDVLDFVVRGQTDTGGTLTDFEIDGIIVTIKRLQ